MSVSDWVSARANCTLADSFTIIYGRVKRDVETFNRLRSDKRGTRQFRAAFDEGEVVVQRMVETKNERGTHVIEDEQHKNDVIVVRCTPNAISVRRGSRLNFEIEPRWNPDSQECDMFVDGTPHPVWRISEMIIGDFLFENGHD